VNTPKLRAQILHSCPSLSGFHPGSPGSIKRYNPPGDDKDVERFNDDKDLERFNDTDAERVDAIFNLYTAIPVC